MEKAKLEGGWGGQQHLPLGLGEGPAVRVKEDSSKFLPGSSSRDGSAIYQDGEDYKKAYWGKEVQNWCSECVKFDTPVRSKKSYLTCWMYSLRDPGERSGLKRLLGKLCIES